MLRSEGDPLTRVVVCTPRREYFAVADPEAHNLGTGMDPRLAAAQHDRLKACLSAPPCEVVDVEELAGHPNSVFTRDTCLVTAAGYVQLRMGLPSRRGEEPWMARILDMLDEPRLGEIAAPGTVEGGDVILAGQVAFIGISGRTNAEGVAQLTALLRPQGYEVRTVAVPAPYLHLGGAMSLIGPGRAVYCRDALPADLFSGFVCIAIPAAGGPLPPANVICLTPGEVIADRSDESALMEALVAAGVRVHALDLSEFRKGRGGPTCLILPVARRHRRQEGTA